MEFFDRRTPCSAPWKVFVASYVSCPSKTKFLASSDLWPQPSWSNFGARVASRPSLLLEVSDPFLPSLTRPLTFVSFAGVSWHLPSELVLPSSSSCFDVAESLLSECLGLRYLHPEVLPYLSPALAKTLGVRSLTVDDLLVVGKALELRLRAELDAHLPALARWLACLYRTLQPSGPQEQTLSKLLALSIIPLASGQLVSLASTPVFFPVRQSSNKKPSAVLRQLEVHVSSVHPTLLEALDRVARSEVHCMLETMGLKEHTPSDLLRFHILPLLKKASEDPQQADEALMVACMMYVAEHWEQEVELLDQEIRPLALVKTCRHGLLCPAHSPVYFGPTYGNAVDLPGQLPGRSPAFVRPLSLL